MFRFLPLVLLAGSFLSLSAEDFYVSNDGSDDNAGGESAPFLTVGYALSQAGNGDRVLLKRGDIFRESGLSVASGVTVTAYGEGEELPAIVGSVEVDRWNTWDEDPSIWWATVNEGDVVQVYYRNSLITLARYPNHGWLRTEVNEQSNYVENATLGQHPEADGQRWEDAQIRWRKWTWWYETRPINDFNGSNRLTLGGSTSGGQSNNLGSGFYIDNTLDELDMPLEWYWDGEEDRLYVMPPEGVSRDEFVVEAAVAARGISLNGGTLDGIAIRNFTERGMTIGSRSTVRDCLIENIGVNGIVANWGAGGTQILNNHLRDILNVGIWWNENPNGTTGTLMEGNLLERIGTVNGYGGSGPWHAAGVIIVNGNGVQFRLNRVRYTGYAGIILGHDGQIVERNVFRYCMFTLNDGGAIYTNSGRNIMHENIVLHTVGDLDSSHPWTPLGHGIWPEFLGNYVQNSMVGNTIYGNGGDGIFFPNNFDGTIAENVIMSNRRGAIQLGKHEKGRSDGRPNQNHDIRDNIIGIGADPWSQRYAENLGWVPQNATPLRFATYDDRDLDFGTMSGTTFVVPEVRQLVYADWDEISLSSWQSNESDWADPDPTVVEGEAYLYINDTEATVDFPLPAEVEWEELDGDSISGNVSIAPFRSVVLMAAGGDASGVNPYQLYTELNGGSAYWDWMFGWPVNLALQDPLADADGDSIPNLMEFFGFSSPLKNSGGPLRLIRDGAEAKVQVFSRPGLRGVDWVFESSPDLMAWTSHAADSVTPTVEGPNGPEVREFSLPEGHLYGRIRIVSP